MARIKPFNGVLYNAKKVNIANAVAPPYDVISPSMREELYKAGAHNIIRLILGKEEKSESPDNNKYSRAGKLLKDWLKTETFLKDEKPSLYVYSQEYLHKGRKRTRTGFIALMKIEDPKKSGVLPHEYTLAKPKKDRLNLIMHTRANLSPIFSLFQDGGNKVGSILKGFVKSNKPLFTVDREGVVHKFWRMEKKTLIEKIKIRMRDKKIFIADGHHRYEVALAYRNKMRKTKDFAKNADYVMMYFTNLSEKGGSLTVLSTHRAVKGVEKFVSAEFYIRLKKYFKIIKARSIKKCIESLEKNTGEKHSFGMYAGKGKLYILTSRKAPSPKKLDVAFLHEFVIDKLLGVKNSQNSIKYVRDAEAALSLVDTGDYQAAFFLRPTAVSDMKALAEKGEMMPQKSTYFYPKLLTGLVINKF